VIKFVGMATDKSRPDDKQENKKWYTEKIVMPLVLALLTGAMALGAPFCNCVL
jgi:hypothetical protein